MTQLLKKIVKESVSIPDSELDQMLSLFSPRTLKKEEYLLQAGQRCNEIVFVESGILRICYPNDKGEETTCHFSLPGDFVTSFSAYNNGKPSAENIQAIMPATCLVILKQDMDDLYRQVPAIQEFGRKAAEHVAMMMETRMALFLNNSAEERYQLLLRQKPILFRTVPLQYLASFLGITPQHLSRLRKKTARGIS